MLWVITVTQIDLRLLENVSNSTIGGLIHILPVAVIVAALINVIQRRRIR